MTVTEWGSEITWDLDGGDTQGPYSDSAAQHVKALCLTKGSHTVNMRDSYGDGWHGGKLEIKTSADGAVLMNEGLGSSESSKAVSITVA
jgi:hypothetical protein